MISQKYHHKVKRNKQFHDSYYVLPNISPDSWAHSVLSGCTVRAGRMLAPSFMLWSLSEVFVSLLGDEGEGLLNTLEVVLTQDAGAKGELDT